jgi:hypothetical protein
MSCPKRAVPVPEKTDKRSLEQNSSAKEPPMPEPESHTTRIRRTRRIERPGVVVEMNSLARARVRHDDRPMRCVSSGYMTGGCSCRATIPAAVVKAAWARELDQAGVLESRFFHFAWQGAVWLAFGLADGAIRGVYCPTHRAERDGRSAGCETRVVADLPAQPVRIAVGA